MEKKLCFDIRLHRDNVMFKKHGLGSVYLFIFNSLKKNTHMILHAFVADAAASIYKKIV